MNITVTHTLAPEILSLIQGAIGLAGAAGAIASPAIKKTADPTVTQKIEVPTQAVIETAEESTSDVKVTVEQVRLAVNEKKDTHKVQIKALLNEFGVASVSALLPANRADFLAKVNAL
ncbi:hypothetical protein PV783_11455 [Chitinophaga sp. CC14]|uniref:hypothetical protein n=1 Tax=Chitinophaga sp. CC14 TaxID=3029199 RepID=UPI003B7F802E